MRVVLQRVKKAQVFVDKKLVSEIKKGILIFLGVREDDTTRDADYLVKKIIGLRIKEDETGKTNLSLSPEEDEIMLISQFTLYGDCRKGRRPSFTTSARAFQGETLYQYFRESLEKSGFQVKTGIFGAYMEVSLINEGPFTLLLDSQNKIDF